MRAATAIAWVQLRLLINSVRRERAGLNIVGVVLLACLATLLSFGMAAGLGMLAFSGTQDPDGDLLRGAFLATFWLSTLFGVLIPFLLSTGGCGLDLAAMRIFPLSQRKLFSITLSSAFFSTDHLFHYPALLVVFVVGVLATGQGVVLGSLFFLGMVVVIVTWAQALSNVLQGVMRHRRMKETLGFVVFTIFIGSMMLPATLQGINLDGSIALAPVPERLLEGALSMLRFAPPHLAAEGLMAAKAGQQALALWSAVGLLVWASLGTLAAYLAFTRFAMREKELSGARNRTASDGRFARFDITRTITCLPTAVLAVASKDLRYLLRSLIGRFNIMMMLVFVAAVAFMLMPGMEVAVFGIDPKEISLYGMLAYVALFVNGFTFNSLGWEGPGFQVYALSPAPLRQVILGKNLGLLIYCVILNLTCILGWIGFTGYPGGRVLTNALLIALCVNVQFTLVGNFASFSFPVARNISSLKNNPSQLAIFISMGTVLIIAAGCFFMLAFPMTLGTPALQPVLLLGWLLVSIVLYFISLRFAAQVFESHREKVTGILEGAT